MNFINSHEVFARGYRDASGKLPLRNPNVERYIFIDDLCGSGTQAIAYGDDIVNEIKAADPKTRVSYFPLFATTKGLQTIRDKHMFDDVKAVVELDDSFKVFRDESRVYRNEQEPISREVGKTISMEYGMDLYPGHPLGYKDGQLLIGFVHNTPDNTLPIIWYDEPDGPAWIPLFRRFPKQYGWSS